MDINQVKSDYDNEVLISRKTLGEVIDRCLELERAVASSDQDQPHKDAQRAVRRFTKIGGFQYGAAYLEFDDGVCTIVLNDGGRTNGSFYTLRMAEDFVSYGFWRELEQGA